MREDSRESDSSIVPEKFANKRGRRLPLAEQMEGSELTKGNERQRNTHQTQGWISVQNKLQLIHQRAKEDKKEKFTALMHHVYNIDALKAAYLKIKREAAPGVDEETWQSYRENLEDNLQDLSLKLKQGGYRAKPVKRAYIPKPNGKQRPLGITTLEDKIVQRATTQVLNAIYEADFLGFSYGFRPGRNQHKALAALQNGIVTRKVSWVLDADISDFYDSINHEWLVKFIEHRIADKRVVRLIQKWLNAGVLENGQVVYSKEGAPQGGSASPLLANVYLHYVYDLWIQQWRKKQALGEVITVRYADDTITGFQYESDAKRFLKDLKERFQKFGLELHPEKTRLIEFGRYAKERRRRRGLGKPETFTFLGFTHICSETRIGKFTVKRQTKRKKLHEKVKEVRTELRKRMHAPIQEVGKWLATVLTGHYRYYGVTGNFRAIDEFRRRVGWTWRYVLTQRSQKSYVTWEQMKGIISRWLPKARIYHSYSLEGNGVTT